MSFLSQISDFDHTSVGLLQRLFLITDGTLTDLVEAAFLEPIAVCKVLMDTVPAQTAIEELDLEAGQPVMSRKILLFGQNSGRNYVYAESLLVLNRLPSAFRDELVASDKPLGRLWSEHRLETWKELLSMHRLPAGQLEQYFHGSAAGDLLTRSYRLISGGNPLMLISEYFPVKYAFPSQP